MIWELGVGASDESARRIWRVGPKTCLFQLPLERRVASVSRETDAQRRNPRQVADLPHATDASRSVGFPRRRHGCWNRQVFGAESARRQVRKLRLRPLRTLR